MSRSNLVRLPLASAAMALSLAFSALEPARSAEDEKSPTTHTVKKGAFKAEVALSGVIEAQNMTPVSLQTEVWKTLTVLDAVEHGARVKKGDSLAKLDMDGIDAEIADQQNTQQAGELALALARAELKEIEGVTPIDLAAAERAKQTADEDLKHFLERLRPLGEKSARFSLTMSQHNLEYTEEELKQLEKMYKADDLTEETEEIILKRARNDVEQAKFGVDLAESRTTEMLDTTLPRLETALKEAARREAVTLEKAKISLPIGPQKARLSLQQLELAQRQGANRLAKLKADRERMLVKAPADGIVYYGRCEHGKWTTANVQATDGKLTHGASLTPNVAFMTIVAERPVFVRASAAEKDLQNLRVGMTGKAVSVAYPNLTLPAKLDSLAAIPTADGKFDSKLSIELGEAAKALMPGMTCEVKLVAFDKPDAIVVPAAAVFEDAAGKPYVYRVGADGSRQKTDITLGERSEKEVEIVQGLLEGDKILLEKPAEK